MQARGNVAALEPWKPEPVEVAPMPAGLRQWLAQRKDEQARALLCRRDAAWMAIPQGTRERLLSMCTDRATAGAHRLRWRDLTDAERAEVGACVRGLVRDLGPVAGALVP